MPTIRPPTLRKRLTVDWCRLRRECRMVAVVGECLIGLARTVSVGRIGWVLVLDAVRVSGGYRGAEVRVVRGSADGEFVGVACWSWTRTFGA